MFYNNPSISPTQQQQQQAMSPQFMNNNSLYEFDLYSASPPQDAFSSSLSPMVKHTHTYIYKNNQTYL
jgi:hypothetical protein